LTSKADGPEVGMRHDNGLGMSPEALIAEWDDHDAGVGKEHKSRSVRRTRVYVDSLKELVIERNFLKHQLEIARSMI